MTRAIFAFPAIAFSLAACSPDAPAPDPEAGRKGVDQTKTESTPVDTAPAPARTAPAEAAAPSRLHQYTALTGCKVIRQDRAEMPLTEVECGGPAGWSLRISDSDARQRLSVVSPDGTATPIDLTGLTNGAFSSFRGSAEWRGPAGESFGPDSLIVRHDFAADPPPMPERSVLVVVRLKPSPCFVTAVPPGDDQNADARALADRGGACVAR